MQSFASASVDEADPAHLVRDDRVSAARAEPDVAGAAPGAHGIAQRARRAVEHVDLAARQRAHIHLGVVRRDRDEEGVAALRRDRKSTRLNSSHSQISYAVFCLKKKKTHTSKSVTVT